MPLLKRLFWVYFLLLIFEGALRKWILPQLSAPLLLVRDPIAFWIIWEAYRTHKWPKKWSGVTGLLALGLVTLCTVQLVALDYPWFAAVYGLRSYLLPFPVAFIMGENLTGEDLRKFGNWTLWLIMPLTAIEVMQYSTPSSSFWNAGASEGVKQIGYTGGHVRASATFSYATGPTCFVTLAAAFIFYGLANPRFAKRWLLWAAAGALVLAIPLTGSRTLVYQLAGVVLCVLVAAFFGVSQLARTVKVIAALLIVFSLVSFLPVFSEATGSLYERFSQANAAEGGTTQSLNKRILIPITGRLVDMMAGNNLLGMGVGSGANAVSRLLVGKVEFLSGEEEIVRTFHEFGWPGGVTFTLFRLFLAVWIAAKALSRAREQQALAWLLAPVTFVLLTLGVLDQPTEQGFMVIAVGFSLAALNGIKAPAEPAPMKNRGRWRVHYNPLDSGL
jgi:hypothetical protein